MRFLFVTEAFLPAFQYGGTPQTVFGLAETLISLGHTCLVISTNAGGDSNLPVLLDKPIIYKGVPVIYTARWRQNTYFYAPNLIRHLKMLVSEYDVALVRGNWGYINLASRLTLPKLSLPYCLSPEGIFDPWAFHHKYFKKLPYWHLVEKWNFSRAAGIVALTDKEATLARQKVPDVTVQVIPNGVNLDNFYPAPGKEELGGFFPQLAHQPFILFLSRLHPKKGLDVLFPAFRNFLEGCQRQDDLRPYLVVAGEGDAKYKNELATLTKELDLGERILFTGLVTGQAKLALLHHCAFMVLPSRSEGLPMAVLEALACGKPVIFTPDCNIPTVAQAAAGLEVNLGVESLSAAMAKLWNNAGLRQEMGDKAIKLVEAKFTWERVARETVRFCQQLLNKLNSNN
jgi:glycosyltransferase involved in cell wall biosynthesis